MKNILVLAVIGLSTVWGFTVRAELHAGTEDKTVPDSIPCKIKNGITFMYRNPAFAYAMIRVHEDGKIETSGDEVLLSSLKQQRVFEKLPAYCATAETVLKEFPEVPIGALNVSLNRLADLDPAYIRDQVLNSNITNRMAGIPEVAKKLEQNANGKSSWVKFDKLGLNGFAARQFSTLHARFSAMCANPKSDPFWLPETGKHYTTENLSNQRARLAEAVRLRQKDIEAADQIEKDEAKDLENSTRKGRDPERLGEHGYSQVFLSFFRDFAGVANDDKSYCKFADALRESLLDPAQQRTLLIAGEPMDSSQIAYSAVLDSVEKKLSGESLKKFQKLRKDYLLVSEKMVPVEAAYLHGVSQFKIGAILTHIEKAHDLPTDYVSLLKDGEAAKVWHRNAPRDGWMVTKEGQTLSRSKNQNPSEAIDAVNLRHNYEISRTIEDYTRYFDEGSLAKRLLNLRRESHVIDMGSGKGFFMEGLTQGFKANDRSSQTIKDLAAIPKEQRPSATGVTIKMDREMPKFDNNRMKVFEKYLDKVSDEELIGKKTPGAADVVTDVFGVFSYVDDVSGLLDRYMRLTKPDGSIYIVSGRSRNMVKLSDNKEVRLFDYLSGLKDTGIKISDHSTRSDGDLGVVIEKDGKPIKLPKLVLESSVEGEPPHRVFVVKP